MRPASKKHGVASILHQQNVLQRIVPEKRRLLIVVCGAKAKLTALR
jgi:hypothetical protein